MEEQSLDRPDPQYKGEAGEVPHDQHRFVCVQNAARGLRILCRSPRKNSTINKKIEKKNHPNNHCKKLYNETKSMLL